jgi:hypothetical protein
LAVGTLGPPPFELTNVVAAEHALGLHVPVQVRSATVRTVDGTAPPLEDVERGDLVVREVDSKLALASELAPFREDRLQLSRPVARRPHVGRSLVSIGAQEARPGRVGVRHRLCVGTAHTAALGRAGGHPFYPITFESGEPLRVR